MPIFEQIVDFKNKHEKEKKWLKEKIEIWNDLLRENNFRNEFKHFIKYDQKIANTFLNMHDGRLIHNFKRVEEKFKKAFPDFKIVNLQNLTEEIEKVERIIAKNSLEQTTIIYTTSFPADPQYGENSWDTVVSWHDLESQHFSEFKEYIEQQKVIQNFGFLVGGLTNNIPKRKLADGRSIIFKIIVPKGFNAGYIDTEDNSKNMILNRNYHWNFLDHQITTNEQDNSELVIMSFELFEDL